MNILTWTLIICIFSKQVLSWLVLAENHDELGEQGSINRIWNISTSNLGEASKYLIEHRIVASQIESHNYLTKVFEEIGMSKSDINNAMYEAGFDVITIFDFRVLRLSPHTFVNFRIGPYPQNKVTSAIINYLKKLCIGALGIPATTFELNKTFTECGGNLVLHDGCLIKTTVFATNTEYCWTEERNKAMSRQVQSDIETYKAIEYVDGWCKNLSNSKSWYAIVKTIKGKP